MLKHKPSPIWKLLGVALMVSLSGCAAAYHDYQGSCIPYLYCAPPPLPFVSYDGCRCPTPGASLYFQQQDGASDTTAAPGPDIPTEAPKLLEQGKPAAPTPQ